MTRVRFRDFDCIVEKRQYANGRPALQLIDAEDGSPIATATVNMPDHPAGPNHVFIKDYSENAGILAALEAAGVVTVTPMSVRSGFVEIPICELQGPFREMTHEERLAEAAGRARYQSKDDKGWER